MLYSIESRVPMTERANKPRKLIERLVALYPGSKENLKKNGLTQPDEPNTPTGPVREYKHITLDQPLMTFYIGDPGSDQLPITQRPDWGERGNLRAGTGFGMCNYDNLEK